MPIEAFFIAAAGGENQKEQYTMSTLLPGNSEDQARRAAKRISLKARKSRWRAHTVDNHGEFQIIDPQRNWVVAGSRCDLTADEVVEFCAEYGGGGHHG